MISPRGSILLVAPLFSSSRPGGLQLATIDLARELERLGWDLTVVTLPQPPPDPLLRGATLPVLRGTGHSLDVGTWLFDRLLPGTRWLSVDVAHRFWRLLPLFGRGIEHLRAHAHNLASIDRLLTPSPGRPDIVVLVDYPPIPGVTALVLDRHPRVVLLSLSTFLLELRPRWWRAAAWVARLSLGSEFHPYMFRPVHVDRVTHVVFPSKAWKNRAIAAGIGATDAHAIYFGRTWPATSPRSTPPSCALLFIGRLAPDKGLHIVLRGFARLHARRPDVTLTIVGEPGRAWYRAHLERLVRKLRLERSVRWHPPVLREALGAICQSHGALLFYSKNPEPVALTLLDAMAAGLPVVSSRPQQPGAMLIDGDTCVCYDAHDSESLASAAESVLDNAALRERLATRAYIASRHTCSLDVMGDRWDRLLLTLLADRGAS